MKRIISLGKNQGKRILSLFLLMYSILLLLFLNGCKKFVQVDPPATSLVSTSVYENGSSAASVLSGIYANMVPSNGLISGGPGSLGYLCGLSADELTNYSTDLAASIFYTNSYNTANFNNFWGELYNNIYVSNAAIEGISASTAITPAIKRQLLGEAKFVRAFFHFYATNLFGDVPLITTTNYKNNNAVPRTPQAHVYDQIVADLKDAKGLLSDNFMTPAGTATPDRVRPNKGAATALLARVYLYRNDWVDAQKEADTVLINSSLYSLDSLNGVFLKNSTEAIWQLESVFNTADAQVFIITAPPGTGIYHVAISPQWLNVFETGDNRMANWIGRYFDNASGNTYYYPYKYKIGTFGQPAVVEEYTMVLRLAEQYLIRAEAEAEQDDLAGAASDLNIIRNRAGLPNTTASTKTDLLTAIYHERQVELFTEWGHRWFDLKRTDSLNSVMPTVESQKGGTWDPYKTLFPIPLSEIKLNPNLTQNVGY